MQLWLEIARLNIYKNSLKEQLCISKILHKKECGLFFIRSFNCGIFAVVKLPCLLCCGVFFSCYAKQAVIFNQFEQTCMLVCFW